MGQQSYTFTKVQLNDLLAGTISMFMEYRDMHGKTKENARFAAVNEIFEGLDAERELVEVGEAQATLQVVGVVDTLKALRDWCDTNLNGSPAGYHEIMVRADSALKKVEGQSNA
jgi:hypothetical protein